MAPRSFLIFSQHSHYSSLYFYIRSQNDDGGHLRVRRLEPDLSARFAVKTLHRGLVLSDERHNDLPGVGHLGLFYNDVITIENVIVAHGFAAHLQNVCVLSAGEISQRDCFAVLYRFQGPSGRDASRQRPVHYMAFEHLSAYGLGAL